MLEEEGMSIAPPQRTQFFTASQAPPPASGSWKRLKNRVEADVGKSESESDEDGGGNKEENGGDEDRMATKNGTITTTAMTGMTTKATRKL